MPGRIENVLIKSPLITFRATFFLPDDNYFTSFFFSKQFEYYCVLKIYARFACTKLHIKIVEVRMIFLQFIDVITSCESAIFKWVKIILCCCIAGRIPINKILLLLINFVKMLSREKEINVRNRDENPYRVQKRRS